MLFAASGVGTFIGNLSAEWTNEHLPRRSLAVSCFVLAALFSGLYLVTQNIQMLSACILATSFVFQNLRVCSDATVQKNAASGAGGRVFAGYDVVSNLSFLLGLIAGLLAMTSMSYHLIVSLLIFGFSTSALAFSMMRRDENQALSNDNSKVSKRQITQADFDSDTVDNWRPRQESEPKGCYRLRS
jgi:predicted MFS family arabinose efflux permease